MLNPLFGDGFKSKKSPTRKKTSKKNSQITGISGTPRIVPSRTLAPPPKVWISKTRPNESEECGWELGNPIWDPKVFWVLVFFLVEGVQRNVRLYIYIYLFFAKKKNLIIYLYTFCSFFLGGEWGVWMTSKTETSNRSHALSFVLFRSLLIVFLVTAL